MDIRQTTERVRALRRTVPRTTLGCSHRVQSRNVLPQPAHGETKNNVKLVSEYVSQTFIPNVKCLVSQILKLQHAI